MSTPSPPVYPCRWKWCRSVYNTTAELVKHVQNHVQAEQPCRLRDLAEQLRAEEGIGRSISLGLGTNSQNSHSLDSFEALRQPLAMLSHSSSSSSLANALSPVLRPTTPNLSAIENTSTPDAIPNPELPELDTMISQQLSPSSRLPFYGSQDSDISVERQLTQDLDMSFDVSQSNPYAGELNWTGTSQSQSQSYSQQHSSASSSSSSQSQAGITQQRSTYTPTRQPWYGSPNHAQTRSFRSGSMKLQSPPGTLNPSMLSQPFLHSLESSSPFIPRTQAPYQSQSQE
ncbi:C2H2-type domain-containing protein [Mycena indigotica]|uniref:C2H2-type domain-containing protein n=1 Tax=Mycena indigotica TaxID=2126181 RepID=A0A8H6SLW8_9AGAR|nr:C2H2-type domain-containing protein [Mycena indigotica]KAF7301821.1 C2H2-type domain-containing protein [Mycena indigotica]